VLNSQKRRFLARADIIDDILWVAMCLGNLKCPLVETDAWVVETEEELADADAAADAAQDREAAQAARAAAAAAQGVAPAGADGDLGDPADPTTEAAPQGAPSATPAPHS
jgi:hypothetical protein